MRKTLDQTKLADSAASAIENFHAQYVNEVETSIQANKFVIVGMQMNPVVSKARKILTEANIDFKYIENGSYFSMWKQRLAIKIWSGWPTFPMVFIDGKLIGGCAELAQWMKSKKN